MTDAAIIKPSELAPRVNLLSAVSRLIREDIGNWARTPDKKPLLQQVREAADLWRIYRYVPYHYLKYDLFRRSIGETYRDYPPSIVADFFVYQMNPKECIDWLEDKLEFDARMRRIGLPFVATLATLELHGDRLRIESRGGAPLSWPELHALVREAAPHGAFLKPRFGLGGKGAFRLSVEEGGFVRDGRVQSEADIAERMRASGYDQFMLQPYFLQHPDVARVHPGSVNTLRILTFRSDDDVEIIASYLRVGGAGAETDNGSGGGFAAKVDLATGRVG
ncbi:MAG: sugar-transfer associated ATP-grasp domain-containing protein, partial [Hyphomonadaceae bacterium]